MSKAFGILFIVGLLWVGLEIYNEGTQNAFGGVFASLSGEPASSDDESAQLSTPKRAGRAWEQAQEKANDRLERQLGEGS
ncbi:MAG: hypothetical protein GY723_01980 [bacterium]|nr:hypothetical protein [bacterium]MCP5065072.1 hypothetical protein [bacterium]